MEQYNVFIVFKLLDGTKYTIWAQSMRSFRKGSKLWLYIFRNLKKLTKALLNLMKLFTLTSLIRISIIIRSLRGFVTLSFHLFQRCLVVLMILSLLRICLLLATHLLMILKSTNLCLISII
jgi:hypothetical protein